MAFSSGANDDLAARLAQLPVPVRIVFFTQTFGCETCLPARQAVDQIASLSDRITVVEHNVVLDKEVVQSFDIDRAPALAVVPDDGGGDVGIRYYGVPAGYEAEALADVIARVSTRAHDLAAASVSAIDAIAQPIHIRVFVTPTCRYCPQVVSLAYRMALASTRITTSVIEASEFPDLAQQYQVTGVPKTVVNAGDDHSHVEILGALPEDQFVARVLGIDALAIDTAEDTPG